MPIDNTADIHARLAAAEAALAAVGQQLSPALRHLDIAVLVPCFNEAKTVGEVVKSFRAALPGARVYVYDNNSHDNSVVVAREAGAVVRREPLQGKGHVVRRMFSDIEADVYLLVDGDGTYDAAAAPRLVSRLVETQADMVVGARITDDRQAYEGANSLSNRMMTKMIASLFGDRFTDMLSGYRAFSRRFVKSYPALSSGLGAEPEMTVHALNLGMITAEVQTTCAGRRIGETTRWSRMRGRLKKLSMMVQLVRDAKPLLFFGVVAGLLGLSGVVAGLLGQPLASATLVVLGALGVVTGVLLGAVSIARREIKRGIYCQVESLAARLERFEETRLTLTSLRAQALEENPPVYGAARRRARAH
jgi:hypothetical protein